MPCFESINFYQNKFKIELFLQNNANFLSAGSSARNAPYFIADFWLRVRYETYAAYTFKFYYLTTKSFWASQITTAIYSNEVVPLSFKYNLLQITIHYEGWHHP